MSLGLVPANLPPWCYKTGSVGVKSLKANVAVTVLVGSVKPPTPDKHTSSSSSLPGVNNITDTMEGDSCPNVPADFNR